MALDELKDNEEVSQVGGLDVLMDAEARPFAETQVIDYINNRTGKGFVVRALYGTEHCA